MRHDVSVVINNSRSELRTFDKYTITQDFMQPGQPFTMSFFRDKFSQTWLAAARQTRTGDTVQILIDGALQMSGYITRSKGAHAVEGGFSWVVSGVDYAGAMKKWEADPRIVIKNTPLSEAVEKIAAPFGVILAGYDQDAARDVVSGRVRGSRGARRRKANRSGLIDLIHPKKKDTAWAVIERACFKLGFWPYIAPTSDGSIGIVIGRPAYDRPAAYSFRKIMLDDTTPDPLNNIIVGDYENTIDDIPTQLMGWGYGVPKDAPPERVREGVKPFDYKKLVLSRSLRKNPDGTFESDGVLYEGNGPVNDRPLVRMPFDNTRLTGFTEDLVREILPPQPLYMDAEHSHSPQQVQRAIQRLLGKRMIHFRTYTATVDGHGQEVNGRRALYAINEMCHLRDDIFGIDEDMLIVRAVMEGSLPDSQKTTLTLSTKGAITLDAIQAQE